MLDVLGQDFTEVHAVELITAEDEEILILPLSEVAQVLTHGIGGALIPSFSIRCLLGGENFNKATAEQIEFISSADVTIQRSAVVLGQHIDLTDTAVDAIADRNIHQAILASKRHGRLCSVFGQWE